MRIEFAMTSVVGAAIAMSGCYFGDIGPMDRFHQDFHYTYPMQPNARIDAESFNGAIDIEGWDRSEVEIVGDKYASSEESRDAIKIDIHNTPQSVEIRAVKPSVRQGSMGAKFTIHVPHSAQVDRVTTSNGQIHVKDVNRAAHLRTSNGAITIANVHGQVDAHTSNGAIDAESLDGAATLKSSNGHIHADRMTGELQAETSNSGIVARMASSPMTPIKLLSSNGSIVLTMDKVPQSDIRAQTSNSSITIHLPADTSAKVTADTSNSSITCDFGTAGFENARGHLRGTLGSGGHAIELTTGNGSIHIAKGSAE